MAIEPLIMPSDCGLRFDSQFAVLRSILIRVSVEKNVGAFKTLGGALKSPEGPLKPGPSSQPRYQPAASAQPRKSHRGHSEVTFCGLVVSVVPLWSLWCGL